MKKGHKHRNHGNTRFPDVVPRPEDEYDTIDSRIMAIDLMAADLGAAVMSLKRCSYSTLTRPMAEAIDMSVPRRTLISVPSMR